MASNSNGSAADDTLKSICYKRGSLQLLDQVFYFLFFFPLCALLSRYFVYLVLSIFIYIYMMCFM